MRESYGEQYDSMPAATGHIEVPIHFKSTPEAQPASDQEAAALIGTAFQEVEHAKDILSQSVTESMAKMGLPYSFRDRDGKLVASDTVVVRSDGRIDDGWSAELFGDRVVASKETDLGPGTKTYTLEDWIEMHDRVSAALMPEVDRMVEAYPDIWRREEDGTTDISSCWAESSRSDEPVLGSASIHPSGRSVRVMYPDPQSTQREAIDKKTIIKNVPLSTFFNWQRRTSA